MWSCGVAGAWRGALVGRSCLDTDEDREGRQNPVNVQKRQVTQEERCLREDDLIGVPRHNTLTIIVSQAVIGESEVTKNRTWFVMMGKD